MTDDTMPPVNDAAEAQPEIGSGVEGALDQLRTEMNEWRDKAMRAAAEAENTRRRSEREMNDARAFAIQRFAKDLLGAADNLERALAAAPQDSDNPALRNLVTGVELTEKALQSGFERNGLKKVDSGRGVKFDPHQHQAVMEQPDNEVEGGAIIQTFQAGYELYGRVIRPAMVVVAAKGSGASAGQASGGEAPKVVSEGAANEGAANDGGAANGYARPANGAGGTFDTTA